MTTGMLIWYWISSLILAALLYRPVKKFIYVSRVRRAEKKLKRETTEAERKEMEKKAIPLSVAIAVTFSFIFNKIILIKYFK
ncbi:MAG: hypothetical protein JSV13_02260 [Nitrospiraceae bacterium]|nr:MAG: hypothetical protein JSV13_02260 [Nitrospiraceae bacterium]